MKRIVCLVFIILISQRCFAGSVDPNEYFSGNVFNTDNWEIDIHQDPQGTHFYTYDITGEQLKPISPDVGDARYDSLTFRSLFYLIGDYDFQMDAFMHRGGPGQGISFVAADQNNNSITYTGDTLFPGFTYVSPFSETWFQFRITREDDTVSTFYRELGEQSWTLQNTETYSGNAMGVYFISWDMNNTQVHYDLVDNFVLNSGLAYDDPSGPSTAVPEPATLVLLALASCGLIRFHRRVK